MSPEARSGVMFRAADTMNRRRFALAALDVYEVGKAWRDVDAAVQEVIASAFGVYLDKGVPAEHGHENHMRAINTIRKCGGPGYLRAVRFSLWSQSAPVRRLWV